MLNMKYCRTENVIAALREWEDDPGTDEHLHRELYELCSRITADAVLVPDMTANTVEIVDESGGEFVEVSQHGAPEIGKIQISPEDWPALRAAINRLVRECRDVP